MGANKAFFTAAIEEGERRVVVQHVEGDVGVIVCALGQHPAPLPIDDEETEGRVAQIAGVLSAKLWAGCDLMTRGPHRGLVEAGDFARGDALNLNRVFKPGFDVVVETPLSVCRQDENAMAV